MHSSKERSSNEENYEGFVRNAHSMAYHLSDSTVYLFGGADEKEVLSDLWFMDHTQWRKVDTKHQPESRTFAPLVYDRKNDRLVLFGGSKVLFGKAPDPLNLLNDTWQFKGGQWERIMTSMAPSPRAEADMTYDIHRETIVLFGGYIIQDGEYLKLKDTWEFYDNDWHLASTEGPSGRHGVSMAYNPKDSTVVLFGGSTSDRQYGESKGETWTWNGRAWKQLDIEQPPGVFNASMVFDKANGQFIRFGGWNGKSRINDTWSFRNDEWIKLDIGQSPIPRNHSDMVHDEKQNRIILFGGHDGQNVFGDTWEYGDGQWKIISDTKPLKRIQNGH
jgi:hypothetical protein